MLTKVILLKKKTILHFLFDCFVLQSITPLPDPLNLVCNSRIWIGIIFHYASIHHIIKMLLLKIRFSRVYCSHVNTFFGDFYFRFTIKTNYTTHCIRNICLYTGLLGPVQCTMCTVQIGIFTVNEYFSFVRSSLTWAIILICGYIETKQISIIGLFMYIECVSSHFAQNVH